VRLAGPLLQLLLSLATIGSLFLLITRGESERAAGLVGLFLCGYFLVITAVFSIPICRTRMILMPVSAMVIALAMNHMFSRLHSPP
ncbi:hypothetical protein L0222_26180, partial [bacterium]|nr:hypothetical protein [bacterium]